MKKIEFSELTLLNNNVINISLQQKPNNKEEKDDVLLDLSVLAQEKLKSLKSTTLELTGDDYTKAANDFTQKFGTYPMSENEAIFEKNGNQFKWKFE